MPKFSSLALKWSEEFKVTDRRIDRWMACCYPIDADELVV